MRIIDASKEVWGDVASNCNWCTFFHTPEWANILQSVFPWWISVPRLVTDGKGNLVVIPIMERKIFGLPVSYAESQLLGVYGGPIYTLSVSEPLICAAWSNLLSAQNTVVLETPFTSFRYMSNDQAPSDTRDVFTQVLNLNGDFDKIENGFRKGHRQSIRKFHRSGLQIAQGDESSIEEYFEIYQETLERWGNRASGFYPRRLFDAMGKHPEMGRKIQFWVARDDKRLVGGTWILSHNEHSVYWHGVTSNDYLDQGVSPALVAHAIRMACIEERKLFDFNPSGGFKGVESFKSGFGSTKLDFKIYRRINAFGKLYRGIRLVRQKYFHESGI